MTVQMARLSRLMGYAANTGFTPFTRHGTHKYVTASTRRPGNMTANHFPSCTRAQAKKFDSRWVPLPPKRSSPNLQNLPISGQKV